MAPVKLCSGCCYPTVTPQRRSKNDTLRLFGRNGRVTGQVGRHRKGRLARKVPRFWSDMDSGYGRNDAIGTGRIVPQ